MDARANKIMKKILHFVLSLVVVYITNANMVYSCEIENLVITKISPNHYEIGFDAPKKLGEKLTDLLEKDFKKVKGELSFNKDGKVSSHLGKIFKKSHGESYTNSRYFEVVNKKTNKLVLLLSYGEVLEDDNEWSFWITILEGTPAKLESKIIKLLKEKQKKLDGSK